MSREERIKEIVAGFKADAKKKPNAKRRPKDIAEKTKPIREVTTNKNYSGEASPHWDFIHAHQRPSDEGNPVEHVLANQDSLSDEHSLYHRPLTEIGEDQIEAIREAMPTLSLRERQAVETMAEGHTLEKAASLMKIEIIALRTLLDRAKKKIKRYYQRRLIGG